MASTKSPNTFIAALDPHCVSSAFGELSQIRHCWAQPKLVICSENVLGRSLARDSTINDAIQQRIATQTIITMDATCCLTCDIKAWDNTILVLTLSIHSALQATHTVVNHRRDDGHIKRLSGNLTAINEVVVELLATPCGATRIVPRFA